MSNFDPSADRAELAALTAQRRNWREATGLSYDKERYLDSFARRRYLKALYIVVALRIGRAYDAQASGELEGDFTPFWTPIPGICNDLEISASHLNRLLKEYCGLTAQQLCDRQRCQTLELDHKLAGDVAKFIRSKFVPGANPDVNSELDVNTQQLEFWRAWREHRKSTIGWSNSTWAAEHGFSSYTRFHRAFTLAFGKSPIQYEAQTMHEAALYFRAAHSLQRRFRSEGNAYPQDEQSFDHHVQLRRDNPIWWSRQRERYGLNVELHDFAKQLNKGEAQFDPEHLHAERPTVCTRETKIAESNPPPSTPANNPWPNIEYPTPNCTQFGVGERREQEAPPVTPQPTQPPNPVEDSLQPSAAPAIAGNSF